MPHNTVRDGHCQTVTETMDVTIRDARTADADTIAAYNMAMAEETEGRPLDPGLIQPGVAAVLDDGTRGRYWVAEADHGIVGQMMVTYEWSDWRNGTMWWIQSVYVHPDWRRQGVFSALYRHVESLARSARDVCGLRLYVERDNERAQRTYRSLGMEQRGYEVMEVDFREQQS